MEVFRGWSGEKSQSRETGDSTEKQIPPGPDLLRTLPLSISAAGEKEGKETRSSSIQQLEGVRDLNLPKWHMTIKKQEQEVRFKATPVVPVSRARAMANASDRGDRIIPPTEKQAPEHNSKVFQRS